MVQKITVMKSLKIILVVLAILFAMRGYSQCGSAQGNQNSFGNDSWIGYFYDGMDNFSSSNYQGYSTETEIFDQSFCGNNCNYAINGCSVNTETYTVRYKMKKNFTDGIYRITIGGDDGVRLSVDNGATYVIDAYSLHSYNTYTAIVHLSSVTRLILDYYENSGDNRVSFSYTYLGSSYGGLVADNQDICASSATVDPAAFTNSEDAMFTTGAASFQWEVSTDNASWSAVSGATSATYDIPAGYPAGTKRYYRRKASRGASVAYSNTVTVQSSSNASAGDQVSFGNESWIGYVYDGRDNFSSNYKGEIFEPVSFDESFGGSNTTKSTTGCDFQTETFSVRFKMKKTLSCGDYTFTIGADDGVRLSIDGGSTWLVSDYSDHGYRTLNSSSTNLTAGSYDFVLEYFENGGGNRVTFSYNMISCVLPVTWYSFEGAAKEGYNEIEWKTASEENNEGFSIERSNDGLSFVEIGWANGNGTTTTQHAYTFEDNQPLEGVNYYRLKQVDFDGKFEYSEIISITSIATNVKEEIQLYPNPSREYVQVQTTSNDDPQMQLINVLAGQVIEPPYEGNGKFNLLGVPAGIYVAKIVVAGETYQERVIVQE